MKLTRTQTLNQPSEGLLIHTSAAASIPLRPTAPHAGLSKDKQEKAKKLAKDFQKGVKDADRPAQAKDRATVIKAYEATAPLLADFLDLTSDVPQDL